MALPSDLLRRGLEALGWLAEERGLAGLSEPDGLAWSLTMHEVFERWLGHLVERWAHRNGDQFASGQMGQTIVPIRWNQLGARSLTSLVPDLVVRGREAVFIFDAKYKGHLEEIDEDRWVRGHDELQSEQHRLDVHQVLAYAALFEAPRVVSVLAYPLRGETWRNLAERRRTVLTATLTTAGRRLELALVGVPMELRYDLSVEDIVRHWQILGS